MTLDTGKFKIIGSTQETHKVYLRPKIYVYNSDNMDMFDIVYEKTIKGQLFRMQATIDKYYVHHDFVLERTFQDLLDGMFKKEIELGVAEEYKPNADL